MADSGRFPSFEEISGNVVEFTERNAHIARLESPGVSDEGRRVLAVAVTDPNIPLQRKQVAIVACGRHGNELGTRVIGMAVLNWLASEQGVETRRRQLVVVVPVANPDGCVREEFFAPSNGLSQVEERTIIALAERYKPDAVVDVHSLGGNDIEAVITAHTTRCAEDEFIQNSLAAEMIEATARRGYPFDVHAAALANGYNNFFAGLCYERSHSVAFGMEVNHLVLGPVQAAESGAAAITTLLEAGNRRFGWQRERGYPNEILIGGFSTSIRPGGPDAATRRQSRVEIWRNRTAFTVLSRETSDRNTVHLTAEYEGSPLSLPCEICCRVRGRSEIRRVRLNGQSVSASHCHDRSSTFVFVQIEPQREEHCDLVLEF